MIIPYPMASMNSVITITNVGEKITLGLAVLSASELLFISYSTSPSSQHHKFSS